MNKIIKAVAFDFDGVIAETTDLKSQLFLKMFEQHPKYDQVVQFEAIYRSMPRRKKIERLAGILGFSAPDEVMYYLDLYKDLIEQHLYQASIIEGFQSFVAYLKNKDIPIYIVSAAIKEEIEKYLSMNNIGDFKKIFDSEFEKKDSLLQISKIENIDHAQILFVGDQQSDYQAAVAAQCCFLGINQKNIFSESLPVLVKRNFTFSHDEVLQEVLKFPVQNPHKY